MKGRPRAPLAAALLLLLFPVGGAAQLGFGVSGGLSTATLSGDDLVGEMDRRTGFNVGAFADVPLGGIIHLVPGVYYVQKGAEPRSAAIDVLAIDYLQIPLLLRVEVSPAAPLGISVLLGPTFGFQVSCVAETPDGDVDCGEDAVADLDLSKGFDLGAAFGAGAAFAVSPAMSLVASAAWDMGLTRIDDSPANQDIRNDAILVNVGFVWTPGR